MNYRWSLGTLVGFPLAILGCAALAALIWLAWRYVKKTRDDQYGEHGLAISAFVAAIVSLVVVIAGTAWGMWPYDTEYHQWRTTSGTVQSVDSRFVGQDRSTTQRFVVRFDDGRQRACDDTRCAEVKAGDLLTLSCKRAWQYTGTPGYDCNYVGDRSKP